MNAFRPQVLNVSTNDPKATISIIMIIKITVLDVIFIHLQKIEPFKGNLFLGSGRLHWHISIQS